MAICWYWLMILAIDVHYNKHQAATAGVLFELWTEAKPKEIFISNLTTVSHYIPGEFYKRELPCMLYLLREHSITPSTIIIDGYVYLDGSNKPGLGKYLYDSLNGEVKIIGVAKNSFKGIGKQYELFRGGSKKPLYITCEGVNLSFAKTKVSEMHGKFRIPTLLKLADQLCRNKR